MMDATTLLDHLDSSLAVVSEDGNIIYTNRAFDEKFGQPAVAWIQRAARALAGERGWLQGFFADADEQESIDVDFEGRTYRVDRIFRDTDEIARVALSFHDVTAERESEQARSDFTSMVVHDLRGPLSGIQGTLEYVLEEKGKMDSMHADLLSDAFHETERMMGLINELLDFSKIQSGNFAVEAETVRLGGLLRRAVRSMQSFAARAEVNLFSAHRRELPPLQGSEEKLTQAIINLISNALKFTPSSGVVSVSAELVAGGTERAAIVVSVTDTGVGIKPEEISAIFGKYKQAKSKSLRGGSGTGLGLYIVKQIVEAHGGEIGVASIPGVGTSFLIRLPLRRAA